MAPSNRQRASRTAGPSRGGRADSEKNEEQPQQKKRQPQPLPDFEVTQGQISRTLPLDLQQYILNIFKQAFPVTTRQHDIRDVMQEVKGHLYRRDFHSAFSKQEYLDVYALRWSAARALAYTDIFTGAGRHVWFRPSTSALSSDFVEHLSQQVQDLAVEHVKSNTPILANTCSRHAQNGSLSTRPSESVPSGCELNINAPAPTNVGANESTKVLCLGGGAGAEIVALAASRRYLRNSCNHSAGGQGAFPMLPQFDILAVDIADWSNSVRKLSAALTSVPELSENASTFTRGADQTLIDPDNNSGIHVAFKQQDILQTTADSLREIVLDVALVTIMFTLNELFSSSLPKTTALLLNLTNTMMISSHLLVVDSPGSYSEIKLGKSKQSEDTQNTKRYPMKWLLDHTLLDVAGKDETARWIKIENEDSKWFRIHDKQGLKYDVELENCRYQLHVYRKIR